MDDDHNIKDDRNLHYDPIPKSVGSKYEIESTQCNCGHIKIDGYILRTRGDMAPQLFSSEAFDMAIEIEFERAGDGIDLDAFFATCPDLAHSPEGEKIVKAYLDDCSFT